MFKQRIIMQRIIMYDLNPLQYAGSAILNQSASSFLCGIQFFLRIYLHFNLGHSCTVVTCLCGALLDSSCTKCLCCTESILMQVGYYIKENDQSACLLIKKSSVVSHCQFPEARSDL